VSSYNIHLNKDQYEALMAKRRAEREAAVRRSEVEPKKIASKSVLGLIGPLKPYFPRSPRKPPIAGRHGDMNKTEARFLSEVLHGEARFEAVTLKLEGGSRYTPDFVTREEGVTVFYEVKGAFRLGSEGRAHTAFYEAASQFPWCRFVWAVLRKGGKWDIKTVDPVEQPNEGA